MSIKKPLVVSFLSGPGCLKSGSAAGVFALLKLHYVNCELVTEFAKDLTWEENWAALGVQDYVLGEQRKRIERVGNKVDVIIMDTSLLFSLVYRQEDITPEFTNYVLELYGYYDNLNIFLSRNEQAEYEDFGRAQDLSASIDVDNKVREVLGTNNLEYTELVPGVESINKVTSLILKKLGGKELTFSIK